MAIISITICNKTSKIIFARQFIEITRKALEEHIVLFSRNIDLVKDSTSIETDKGRYLYIRMENLYLVLITTKDSNIIEDMEVLKLAHRIISDLCGNRFNEIYLIDNGFEIALAFDDLVNYGYREGINMMQIKQFLLMDSFEEKEFRKQQETKEKAAKKHFDIRMREIEAAKRDKNYFSDAIGSSETMQLGGRQDEDSSSRGGFSNSGISNSNSTNNTNNNSSNINQYDDSSSNVVTKKPKTTKGLSLGKKKHHVEEVILKDENNSNNNNTDNTNTNTNNSNNIENEEEQNQEEDKFNALSEPIKIELEEKIKGEINQSGEFKRLEIRGEGFITILNPAKNNFSIEFSNTSGLEAKKFNTNKIDKKLFEKGVLAPDVSFIYIYIKILYVKNT